MVEGHTAVLAEIAGLELHEAGLAERMRCQLAVTVTIRSGEHLGPGIGNFGRREAPISVFSPAKNTSPVCGKNCMSALLLARVFRLAPRVANDLRKPEKQ